MTAPRLRGTEPPVVRTALENRDPLPGTTGFAGAVDDRLVRDVLGRVPLFVDGASSTTRAERRGPSSRPHSRNRRSFRPAQPRPSASRFPTPSPTGRSPIRRRQRPTPLSRGSPTRSKPRPTRLGGTTGISPSPSPVASTRRWSPNCWTRRCTSSAFRTVTTSRPHGRRPTRWGAT